MSLQAVSKQLHSKGVKHIVVAATPAEADILFRQKPSIQSLLGYLIADKADPATVHVSKSNITIVLRAIVATLTLAEKDHVRVVVKTRGGKKVYEHTRIPGGVVDALKSLDSAMIWFNW